MEIKKLIKSKTFWAGIISVGIGIAELVQGGDGTEKIIIGLGLIFGREAIAKIQK